MPSPCLEALNAVLEALDSPGDGGAGWEGTQDAIDALRTSLAAAPDADAAETLRVLGEQSCRLQADLARPSKDWSTFDCTVRLADEAWAALACRGPAVLGSALDRVGLQLGGLAAAALAAQTRFVVLYMRSVRAEAPARPALIGGALHAIRDVLLLIAELAESWGERHLLIASETSCSAAVQCVTLALALWWKERDAKTSLLLPEAQAVCRDAALRRQLEHAALLCTWKLLQSPAPEDERWLDTLQLNEMLLSLAAVGARGAAAAAGVPRREAAALTSQHQAVAAAAAAWARELRRGAVALRCAPLNHLAMLCATSAHAVAEWQAEVPPADLAAWAADDFTCAAYAAQEVAAVLGTMHAEREQQPGADAQAERVSLVRTAELLVQAVEETVRHLTSCALRYGSRVPVRLSVAVLASAEAFLRLRSAAQLVRSAARRARDGDGSSGWIGIVLEDVQELPAQALGCGVHLACAESRWQLAATGEELTGLLSQQHATALAAGRSAHAALAAGGPADDFERVAHARLLAVAAAATAAAFEAAGASDERRLLLSEALAVDAAAGRFLGPGSQPCQILAPVLAWSDGSGDSVALQRARALALRRSCANLACTSLAGRSEAECKGRLCGGCRAVRFCSEACSKEAWRAGGHKAACALLAAERRGGGGE
eukprot:scaffold2.g6941.t1